MFAGIEVLEFVLRHPVPPNDSDARITVGLIILKAISLLLKAFQMSLKRVISHFINAI
jgi:hypothetical protein